MSQERKSPRSVKIGIMTDALAACQEIFSTIDPDVTEALRFDPITTTEFGPRLSQLSLITINNPMRLEALQAWLQTNQARGATLEELISLYQDYHYVLTSYELILAPGTVLQARGTCFGLAVYRQGAFHLRQLPIATSIAPGTYVCVAFDSNNLPSSF